MNKFMSAIIKIQLKLVQSYTSYEDFKADMLTADLHLLQNAFYRKVKNQFHFFIKRTKLVAILDNSFESSLL